MKTEHPPSSKKKETEQPPLARSRTSKKFVVDMESYKPRDWDYQSPKHQIRPPFVLGRSKKRSAKPPQSDFPVFKDYSKSTTSLDFNKRELKPAIYRSYILSQIYTLPGAVKVDESKINDDQYKKERIKVVRNKNLSYVSKILNDFGSNVAFLPGSTNKILEKGKTCANFRYEKEKKEKEEKNKNAIKVKKAEKKKKEKVISPIRDRIKRKIKIQNKK